MVTWRCKSSGKFVVATQANRPGREGTAESSEERICEPRDTNRIERATVTAGARRPLPRGPWHQLAEPPDADPHVGWCGRAMVRITHHPLSRLTASSVMARWDG